jgi:hypothetical protein
MLVLLGRMRFFARGRRSAGLARARHLVRNTCLEDYIHLELRGQAHGAPPWRIQPLLPDRPELSEESLARERTLVRHGNAYNGGWPR